MFGVKEKQLKEIEKSVQVIDDEKKDKVFRAVIKYFIGQKAELMSALSDEREDVTKIKKLIREEAREQIRIGCMGDKKLEDELTERFEQYMWGMYILEPLIADKEVFDITTYSHNNVRVERLGRWEDGGVYFKDKADYEQFISLICTRNKKNISVKNSQIIFTDAVNNPDYILRCNVSYAPLNASGISEFHIRKIPKSKFTLDQLVELGYMNESQKEFMCTQVKKGKNFLFSGANGSGKTFGVNALIDEIPLGKSGLIIQESDELFTNNPDFLVQHVIENTGEGKINYGLRELAKVGLMDAREIFILGEVKSGDDAASLPMITNTGSQFIMTGHGKNAMDAVYKIADYMKQSTSYSLDECLSFLTDMIVVYCKKFKVLGMAYIRKWDRKNNRLIIEELDEECNKVGTEEKIPTQKEDVFDMTSCIFAVKDEMEG